MERITKFRVTVFLLLIMGLLGFFSVRLFASQVVNADENSNNMSTYTTMTRVKAARGDILDRNGNVLVRNRASYDLTFNNYVILSADGTNEHLLNVIHLCQELGFEYNDHFPVTFVRPYEYVASDLDWQTHFTAYLADMDLDSDITAPLLMQTLRKAYSIPETWTDEDARRVIGIRYELALRSDITNLSSYVFIDDATDQELAAVQELNIPGLMVESTTVREYNTTYAAHILGYVGAMDAEEWEKSYMDNDDYEMDAKVGKDGFEAAFEEYLHGVDGWRVDTVDKEGNIIKSYYEKEPRAGNNVETTLDLRLQQVAENSLEETLTLLKNKRDKNGDPVDGNDVQGAAVVAIDVRTGEVLVCASYPTYDPNEFFEIYNELLADPMRPLINRPLQGEYPPGSTYKMVTAIAGIDIGSLSINSTIYDEGVYDEYGDFAAYCLRYSSSDGAWTHGEINIREALKYSCNYFFYDLSMNWGMGISALDEVAKAMGLGEPTGVEVPEYVGVRANPQNKWDYYTGSDAEWFDADTIMAAIGQGMNQFTPMQLCSYAATLANRGTRYKATFLKRVVADDYTSLLKQNEPVILSEYEISDEAYQAYSDGMLMVTNEENGTAYETFGYLGYEIMVCGKTGTAEHDPSKSDHGAFICYAPADNPEIAIAVYAEQGGHGSDMANIAKDILNAWFFNADKAGDVTTDENRVS